MFVNFRELLGKAVQAPDGPVGQLEDFYFDDQEWRVRYLVLDTGDWLEGRRILLSVQALGELRPQSKDLAIQVRRERIESGPVVSLAEGITREQEIALHNYYEWPFYWIPSGDQIAGGIADYPLIELASDIRQQTEAQESRQWALRSAKEVFGYRIQARDGEIGQVDDFIFDTADWRILYMIVDTGSWLPGRKVIVSPSWISEVGWGEQKVSMDLKRGTIEQSPAYDPSQPLSRDFETRLYDHYSKKRYWE